MAGRREINRLLQLELSRRPFEQLRSLPTVVGEARPGHQLGHALCGAAVLLFAAGEIDGATAVLHRAGTVDLGATSFSTARAAATTLSTVLDIDVPWARHRVYAHMDRAYWTTEQRNQTLPTEPDEDLTGTGLLRVACAAARHGQDERAEALLRRFLEHGPPSGWELIKANRVLLELLIDAGRLAEAGEQLRGIMTVTRSAEALIEPRVASLVTTTGCTTDLFAVEATECAQLAAQVMDAFGVRRQEPTPNTSTVAWPAVLDRLDAAISALAEEGDVGALPRRRPGASPADIAAVEARLGVTLPPSYRAFLATADGYEPGELSFAPVLQPSASIGWLRELAADTAEGWSEGSDMAPDLDADYFVYDELQDPVRFHPGHVPGLLLVSTDDSDGAWLLNPAVVFPDGEWEAWHLAAYLPGAARYRNFAELITATIDTLSADDDRDRGRGGESGRPTLPAAPSKADTLRREPIRNPGSGEGQP